PENALARKLLCTVKGIAGHYRDGSHSVQTQHFRRSPRPLGPGGGGIWHPDRSEYGAEGRERAHALAILVQVSLRQWFWAPALLEHGRCSPTARSTARSVLLRMHPSRPS